MGYTWWMFPQGATEEKEFEYYPTTESEYPRDEKEAMKQREELYRINNDFLNALEKDKNVPNKKDTK